MRTAQGYEHGDAFENGTLRVSSIHTLYYEQYGKPDGKPVIFLHGGPGDSTSKDNTVFFDPAVYRVVLLDQRGAGKSTPSAEVWENTTQHLVADIETLRLHLKITKWAMAFGGSWGVTLALAYAEAHPDLVGSLVLRGVFLGTREEFEWSQLSSAAFFPELEETYLGLLTPEERKTPVLSYYKRLLSDDRATRMAAADAWTRREILTSAPSIGTEMEAKFQDEKWLVSGAKIGTHYFTQDCFLEENQLLNNAGAIQHLPTSIVQGRLDLLCPPKWAYALHKALPESRIYFIDEAAHGSKEPGTLERLVQICNEYAEL